MLGRQKPRVALDTTSKPAGRFGTRSLRVHDRRGQCRRAGVELGRTGRRRARCERRLGGPADSYAERPLARLRAGAGVDVQENGNSAADLEACLCRGDGTGPAATCPGRPRRIDRCCRR